MIAPQLSTYGGPADLVHPSTIVESTMRNTWRLEHDAYHHAERRYYEKLAMDRYKAWQAEKAENVKMDVKP